MLPTRKQKEGITKGKAANGRGEASTDLDVEKQKATMRQPQDNHTRQTHKMRTMHSIEHAAAFEEKTMRRTLLYDEG